VKLPLISVRNLQKSYGSGDNYFEALRGIDLDIHEGESIAIVGKSGSGKSTLMHLIALMDKPTSGEIFFEGSNTGSLKGKALNEVRNSKFGFVFQQFFLSPRESVLENVSLPLRIAGESQREQRKRGMKALEQLGIEDKAKNKATDLSGGQKQRVVIARALVNSPKVIFADEPTGNLDSTTGSKVVETLFDLNRNENITLVLVTHDEELAARCQSRVFIQDGQITKIEESVNEAV
jgi:putative ABC transport system ATP-binding protein